MNKDMTRPNESEHIRFAFVTCILSQRRFSKLNQRSFRTIHGGHHSWLCIHTMAEESAAGNRPINIHRGQQIPDEIIRKAIFVKYSTSPRARKWVGTRRVRSPHSTHTHMTLTYPVSELNGCKAEECSSMCCDNQMLLHLYMF